MKKIIKLEKTKLQGNVTLDLKECYYTFPTLEEAFKQMLPTNRLFENITIRNFSYIPENLLYSLTNNYLHGTKINFVHKDQVRSYKLRKARPFLSYKWVNLDLSAPVPKSLAEFKLTYLGKMQTYLQAISSLKSNRYLPNEIWTALDIYSQERLKKAKEYNKGDYTLAEEWYKKLFKDFKPLGVTVYSPNKKTFYEATAEIEFEKFCEESRTKDLEPLTEVELGFLKKYAPIYGVEIPAFRWKINSRKTEHGYTQEPEFCICGNSRTDWDIITYDSRNDNLPSFVRQGLVIKENKCDKYLRDAYYHLNWLIENLGDKALMPGWKRCPECNQLYREHEGCECGYCQGVTLTHADNLFNSISSTYEDYENTIEAYEDLDDLDDYTLID